ncbi:MAG: pilus (MSHA type) biogenesis protein MshL [Gallionella sp.]|nr:pilus (MSHA type) biogenesis protein MshL [Gallionella sp.]
MRSRNTLYLCCIGAFLSSCGTKPIQPSEKHIQQPPVQVISTGNIPQPIRQSIVLPPPTPPPKVETYSVVVSNVPAQEILFALARDSQINLDIHTGIQGNVTLNALNQTLPQILTRISRQIDMRYELDNGNLTVMPDAPYLHSYKIDYVNMARDSESILVTSAQVTSTAAAAGSGGGTNNSSISLKGSSKNRFWETLTQNIKDILHETDKILPEGSSETSVQQVRAASSTGTGLQAAANNRRPVNAARGSVDNSPTPVSIDEGGTTVTRHSTFREAAAVIASPEAGLITVRATGRQHEKILEFIAQVMGSARRQVMIEATIVEVRLNDQYKQGINWSALIKAGGKQFKLVQSSAGLPTGVGNGMFGIITNPTAASIGSQVSLLESFGNVKVLSSPKLSVLNNQTAIIKVVDNLVYFTIAATTVTNQTGSQTNYTSSPTTLPVGFTMSVTPQISDNDSVLFNLKPAISRVTSYVNDPNPDLARAGVVSRIPQTQTREMESVLKIENNQIAVMGGLMQDSINDLTDAIPGLSKIPLAGELFKQRNDSTEKTELVIFLRPMVIKNASIDGDFSAYRDALPDRNFFKESSVSSRK